MNLLLGAIAEGFLFAALALAIHVSWRLCALLDLTVDGAFMMGGALCAVLLVNGLPPLLATPLGGLGGAVAGTLTGLLCTRLRINPSLAGVLVSSGLYSVALVILGGGTLTLADAPTVMSGAGHAARRFGAPEYLPILGTAVPVEVVASLLMLGALAAGLTLALGLFLRTNLGLALRASGGNPAMARALGISVDRMLILGLGLANGLTGFCGALEVQYLGYANVQLGVGAVVTGLATLLIGESLLGRQPPGRGIVAAPLGALLYRLLIAAAIWAGLAATALRLLTALLVLAVLLVPRFTARFGRAHPAARHA